MLYTDAVEMVSELTDMTTVEVEERFSFVDMSRMLNANVLSKADSLEIEREYDIKCDKEADAALMEHYRQLDAFIAESM